MIKFLRSPQMGNARVMVFYEKDIATNYDMPEEIANRLMAMLAYYQHEMGFDK